jgi:hypothetical protein
MALSGGREAPTKAEKFIMRFRDTIGGISERLLEEFYKGEKTEETVLDEVSDEFRKAFVILLASK